MPNDLRLRVGAATAIIPLGGTDAQVAAALTRFATSLGIPTTGTAVENLTAILEHVRDSIRRRSKEVQIADATRAAQAAIIQQAEVDNSL